MKVPMVFPLRLREGLGLGGLGARAHDWGFGVLVEAFGGFGPFRSWIGLGALGPDVGGLSDVETKP